MNICNDMSRHHHDLPTTPNQPGTRNATPINNVDLYPTFLAVAGTDVPKKKTLDGESLLPLFNRSGMLNRQSIYWHFPGYLNDPVIRGRDPIFRTQPVSVIRKGEWKLHLYYEEWQLDGGREKLATNNAIELYNIKEDIGERKNLANEHAAKRDELLDDLLKMVQVRGSAASGTEESVLFAGDAPMKAHI